MSSAFSWCRRAWLGAAVLSLGVALVPEAVILPSIREYAQGQSVDGQVSVAGIQIVLLSIRSFGILGCIGALAAWTVGLLASAPESPPVRAQPSRRDREWMLPEDRIPVVAICAVVLLVAWPRMSESLSYDEAFTALNFVVPDAPWQAFTRYVFLNNHPLYSFVTGVFASVLGREEWILRAAALLAALATVPASFVLARELGVGAGASRTVVAWRVRCSASLMALSPVILHFAAEARGYSMLYLGAVVSTIFLLRVLRSGSPAYGIFYLVSAWLTIWVHLSGTLLVAAQMVAVAAASRTRTLSGDRARAVFVLGSGVAVLALLSYSPIVHRVAYWFTQYSVLETSAAADGLSPLSGILGVMLGPWSHGRVPALVVSGLLITAAAAGTVGLFREGSRDGTVMAAPVLVGLAAAAFLGEGVLGGGWRFYVFASPLLFAMAGLGLIPKGGAGAGRTVGFAVAIGILGSGLASELSVPEHGLRRLVARAEARVERGEGCVQVDWPLVHVYSYYGRPASLCSPDRGSDERMTVRAFYFCPAAPSGRVLWTYEGRGRMHCIMDGGH